MECCLGRMLRYGIDGDLSALCVSLTIAVHHLERYCFNVQRPQGACSIPCRNRGHLIFCPVRLRQHEPITTEHEPLERGFGFDLVTVWAFLFDGALARDRHT